MYPSSKPILNQLLSNSICIISLLGNGAIVYATLRSRALRSPCNILIALVSLSDMVMISSILITTIVHNIVQSDLIPQPYCAYLQLAPLFASSTSPFFLLGIAMDRLFSLMRFYKPTIASHSRFYITAHTLPGCILGTALDVIVLINQKHEEKVICSLTAPMQGTIHSVFSKLIIAVCVLIVLCNASFMYLLKKLRLNSEKTKSIYRSVVVISLSVVFGYISTLVLLSIKGVLLLNASPYLDQIASLLINVSISVNFFLYYGISKEYRAIFDKLLGIGHIKAALGRNVISTSQQTTLSTVRLRNRSTIQLNVSRVG
uniref:G_PROTEIN_RECEP_F1_2 domain-containing protein n=1 Tax=Haemonchus contortus TaxID=6289 RepID=A0A7I4YQ15_HAECO